MRAHPAILTLTWLLAGCDGVPRGYMRFCETDEDCGFLSDGGMVCADIGDDRCTFECDVDEDCPAHCADHGIRDDGLCEDVGCDG